MLCYIYGDYFELYVPGKLAGMLDGNMLPLGKVTEGMLVGTSAMLATQALMVFLSLVLPPSINKWLNIVFGLLFGAVTMLVISQGGWLFYRFLGVVEIVLLLTLVWQAWTWPRARPALVNA